MELMARRTTVGAELVSNKQKVCGLDTATNLAATRVAGQIAVDARSVAGYMAVWVATAEASATHLVVVAVAARAASVAKAVVANYLEADTAAAVVEQVR